MKEIYILSTGTVVEINWNCCLMDLTKEELDELVATIKSEGINSEEAA